jgi:hypothetical protein
MNRLLHFRGVSAHGFRKLTLSHKYVAAALLYPALALFSATAQSTSPPSEVATESTARAAVAQQTVRDGLREVEERADGKSGVPLSQALSGAATELTATDMAPLSTTDAKKYAASHFMGFYTLNAHAAADVCRAEGVDLTAYVRAFHLKHAAEFAQAEKIMTASGFSIEQMAPASSDSRKTMEATFRQAMLDLAAALHKTKVADGCAYVAAHVPDSVSAQSFAEQNPEVEAALMSD